MCVVVIAYVVVVDVVCVDGVVVVDGVYDDVGGDCGVVVVSDDINCVDDVEYGGDVNDVVVVADVMVDSLVFCCLMIYTLILGVVVYVCVRRISRC